jgi:hypothetical protein
VVRSASDIAGSYRHILAETASGVDALLKEAIAERARLMAETLMGEDSTPLEALLSKRRGLPVGGRGAARGFLRGVVLQEHHGAGERLLPTLDGQAARIRTQAIPPAYKDPRASAEAPPSLAPAGEHREQQVNVA